MPSSEDSLRSLATRDDEQDARRRYGAAIAAAMESLRHAEQRFDETSAAIDLHLTRALAAVSLAAFPVARLDHARTTSGAVAAPLATAEVMPA